MCVGLFGVRIGLGCVSIGLFGYVFGYVKCWFLWSFVGFFWSLKVSLTSHYAILWGRPVNHRQRWRFHVRTFLFHEFSGLGC
jgi:hypothetical protein